MRRSKALGILLAVAVFALTTGAVAAAKAVHQSTDVLRFDSGAVVGSAKLVRNGSGLHMQVHTSIEGELFEMGAPLGVHWMPGDATTNWWVVFNHPAACSGGVCGEDDVFAVLGGGPNPAGLDILFATGHVAGSRWNAGAALRVGDVSGSILPLFGVATVGLTNPLGAEVHLIMRSHGPAQDLPPGVVSDAIHTVDAGCDVNTCGDAQFAVFPAP